PSASCASQYAAASTLPRPLAQRAARCFGSSASCAANTLQPACCLGPSAPSSSTLPRLLGLMCSQHAAASTLHRPLGPMPRCLGPSAPCAASSPLPRPLGLMRSQHAAASTLHRPLGPMRGRPPRLLG
ncbi:unnamed protein product, partial [Musa banksii]